MKLKLFFSIVLSSAPLLGFDNHHFYRASYFFHEPRIEKSWLSTLEISVAGGSTNHSRNSDSETVPLFDIYGASNFRLLGSGVPDKDPNNVADLALINIANTPSNKCFGYVSFAGKFKIIESYINLYQNFTHGFFTFINIPIRRLELSPKAFEDLSPNSNDSYPNRYTPEWRTFLANFDDILAQHNICLGSTKETGVGDVSVYMGWTRNFYETETVDFIDTTLKFGVITPTGKARNENNPFSLPLGYNKHLGFSCTGDGSLGIYEWLTFGIHGGIIAFLKRCQQLRMKTDFCQSGMIKLAQGSAKTYLGPIWDIGAFIKADHLGQGLSILLAYAYVNKRNDTVCPSDKTIFSPQIVNSDAALQGWDMHNIHLLVEYDFTKEGMRAGPRLGFIYNANVGGRRTFKTNMVGGYFGLDIAWQL